MAGGFVFVVGPSGAGKDTLIRLAAAQLADDRRFHFPRRLVTRAGSAFEDHDTIAEAEFEDGMATGRFALAWRAHGLGYALPGSCRTAALDGCVVVCNVSRQLIGMGRASLPNVAVVEVTAPYEVLAQRLAGRGRGEDGDLGARLARSREIGATGADLVIVNDRTPQEGADRLVAFLRARVERLEGAAAQA
jgi:ribose 1,5-bisphosphokinase